MAPNNSEALDSPTPDSTKRPSSFSSAFSAARAKIWQRKRLRALNHLKLHRSFRRSYREDYLRQLHVPGLLHHALDTFGYIFKNWRLFLPLLLLFTTLYIILVGLMSEETYLQFQAAVEDANAEIMNGSIGNFARSGLLLLATVTTGGLNQGMSETQQIFAVLLFLVIWLVTIYLLRHILAGHRPKLRDGLYNALAPFLSTLCIFLVILVQAIPIFIVIITYSAAVATNFLATPFYALLYFIFAALLILLSTYLISSSFLALIAVTAPGLYPSAALQNASDLAAGRRTKLIIRLFYLVFVLAVTWIIVMLPIILLDLLLKNSFTWLEGIPFASFFLLLMTCFSFIYIAAYCYLFYRRMLEND